MDELTLVLMLSVATLAFAVVIELTNLYFILKTRAAAGEIRTQVPLLVQGVADKFDSIDWKAVGEAAWQRVEAGLEGIGGAAKRQADLKMGKEVLDELAAIDWGHPVANGMWAALVKANGPKMVGKLGSVARRLPYVGRLFDDDDEGPSGESGLH